MKVLLLGEFSSYQRYLKEGLLELGHDVKLFANGDSWKKIGGADGKLYTTGNRGLKRQYSMYVEPYLVAKQFSGFDVVHLVNTGIYSSVINPSLIEKIASQNNLLSLAAVGSDYSLVRAYQQGRFDYYAFDYDTDTLRRYDPHALRGKRNIDSDRRVVECADIIIPGSCEYAISYAGNPRMHDLIPFPININGIEYCENRIQDKIVFFHGLSREAFKGTPFIREAFKRLQETYPHDVEVIMEGRLPFDEYVKVMQRTNVVVDQCCAYGYGINACIALAQGKVVLSGCRKEALDALRLPIAPVIHIQPDVNQIYDQLKWIVENKQKIAMMGGQSRQHVEAVHDHVKVAQQYVDAWKSTGKV